MKLRTVHIENFKCFLDSIIRLRDINCVIGENSSGKTALMQALDLTLGHKNPTRRSFSDPEVPVRITLEFTELEDREAGLVREFVQDDRLVVAWEWVQRQQSKPKIVAVTQRLCDSSGTLPRHLRKDTEPAVPRHLVSSLPAFYQIPPVYHFEDILKTDDRADPLSRGVSGSLSDASNRLRESIQSTIHDFLNHYCLQDLQEIEDVIEVVSEFQEITIKPKMRIEGQVEPEISLHLSVYDGIESDLQLKGHGLQRLVLYGQLIATIRQQERERRARNKPPRSYVIGLEEIELYLHPMYRSIMLNQLKSLACREQFQVLYTSHSPSMIDVFDLESVIRLSRAQGHSEAYQISYTALANKANAFLGENAATDVSVRERVGEILDVETCQSLFARQVIIVEGNTERYVLPELFGAAGFGFERHGIAIVSAGGKGNIDKLIFLMEQFGIPYFVIFDQDISTTDTASRRQSDNLRELLGIPSEFASFRIGEKYCVFEEDFEHTFCRLYPGWTELDQEAKRLIGAKGGSGKGLRAKYASRQVAGLIEQQDPTTRELRSFMDLLCNAINKVAKITSS